MSRTYHHYKNRDIRVRGIRRPTDLRRLSHALIDLAHAQAEAEAEAEHKSQTDRPKAKKGGSSEDRTTRRKNQQESA
jgi:hypothetical protein